ncbi:hypothetical protein HMN09_01373600 [Mycena chlorophos]|uniref:Aquaporin n=1 Tax=Mycena chlorophos TaxID=658473 RepID=A0A8H6VQV2_MYCCL|nr:hypothetical protein HMN09_01373600 [Mycena chlorophos]
MKEQGVCVLVIFGTGANCQVVLSSSTAVASGPRGDYLSINFGWAVGAAMGVWVSGGYSGALFGDWKRFSDICCRGGTSTLPSRLQWLSGGARLLRLVQETKPCHRRGFPWSKVPVRPFCSLPHYLVDCGRRASSLPKSWAAWSALLSSTPTITMLSPLSKEGIMSAPLTQRRFSRLMRQLPYMTNVSCFFDEFLGTAVLLVMVLALNDKKNLPPPNGLAPLFLFLLILGIGASLGMETGYAVNPARDLGPRLLTSMVGYGGAVYTYRRQYWFWCPILGPILGAQFGCAFYDVFMYAGDESPVNQPDANARANDAAHSLRRNAPAGFGVEGV